MRYLVLVLCLVLLSSCSPGSECSSDDDCFKDSCCHATSCTAIEPECGLTACTLDCQPDTLDCGGSCVCDNGQCVGVMPSE